MRYVGGVCLASRDATTAKCDGTIIWHLSRDCSNINQIYKVMKKKRIKKRKKENVSLNDW